MKTRSAIFPLTSLRFFFAAMVFVSHVTIPEDSLLAALKPFTKQGHLGVSFFYILSGFILAYNYRDKILSNSISRRDFWVARIARVWPMHIVTLVAIIPLTLMLLKESIFRWTAKLLINASMLHSMVPIKMVYFSMNMPSWSISNELFFYLAFPFLIPVIYNSKYRAVIIASFYTVFIAALFSAYYFRFPFHHALFYVNPLFRLSDFILGILAFELYRSGKLQKLFSPTTASVLEIASIGIFFAMLLLHQPVAVIFKYSFYYWVPMFAIIFVFSYQSGVLSRLLSNKTLVLLGEISFSFYLIHSIVIRYSELIIKDNPQYDPIMVILVQFSITIGLSYLCFTFIEKPANKYLKERFSSKKVPLSERTDAKKIATVPVLKSAPVGE